MKIEVLKSEYYNYFNLNGYYEPDIAIHCDTQEKAEILMAMYYVLGKKWGVNPIFIEKENRFVTRWKKNKTDTCYRISPEDDSCLVNGSKAYYENKDNVVVVNFNEIFKSVVNELTENPEDYYETNTKKKSLFGNKKKEIIPSKSNSSVEEKIINEVLPDNNSSVETDNSNIEFAETSSTGEIISDSDVPVRKDTSESVDLDNVNTNAFDFDNNESGPEKDTNVSTSDNAENTNENDIFASGDKQIKNEDENDDISNDKKNSDFINKFNKLVEQYEEKDKSDSEVSNKHNVLNSDVSSGFHELDYIPIMKPFIVKNDIFEGRIFRFNENYLREEFKAKNFWIQCNCEWELSLILKCAFDNQIELLFEGNDND